MAFIVSYVMEKVRGVESCRRHSQYTIAPAL